MGASLLSLLGCGGAATAAFDPLTLSPTFGFQSDGGAYAERTSPSTVVASDGDLVGTWTDLSGNSNHAAATTDAKRPTYRTNVQNGRPAMQLDGVDDYLVTPSLVSFPSKRGSLFAVFRNTLGSGYATIAATYSAATTHWQYLSYQATNKFKWYDGVGAPSAPNFDTTSWQIQALIRDGDTTVQYYLNGSNVATLSITNNQPSMGVVALGANTSGTERLTGYLGELWLFPTALSGSDLTGMLAYLNTRWAIY